MIGFFIPLFLTAFWLHQTGVWDDFVEWSFRGSASYIRSGVETIPFWHNLLLRGGSFILATFLTWILALRVTSHQSQDTTLILLWFLLSLIPVCMGGRFYGHYFIQILPPLCLLAAVGLPALISRRFKTAIAIGMIIPAVVTSVARWNYEKFDSKFPDDQLFQQKKIGEWLKANTQEDETLFVWGFATAIYFHAERKASSRFLWADLLTGKIPGSSLSNQKNFDTAIYSKPKAWEKFWEDMHANPPDYFIDTSSANIHNYGKYHLNQYPLLQSFLQDHYIFLGIRENTNIYKIK